jgi:hypothetical protein
MSTSPSGCDKLCSIGYSWLTRTTKSIGIQKLAERAIMIKKMIFASMGVAGLVASLSLLDLLVKIPFAGYSLAVDMTYLISSAIVGYLSWEAYRENH